MEPRLARQEESQMAAVASVGEDARARSGPLVRIDPAQAADDAYRAIHAIEPHPDPGVRRENLPGQHLRVVAENVLSPHVAPADDLQTTRSTVDLDHFLRQPIERTADEVVQR